MSKISGNTVGLKSAQLKKLDRIARRRIAQDLIVSPELAREMAELSHAINRQIGVLISRSGRIEYVIVGDSKEIVIPVLSQIRSSGGRLKGLRCIHTHIGGEDLSEDDLMDLLFLRLDLMAVIKVESSGLPEKLYAAHLVPVPVSGKNWILLPPVVCSRQDPVFTELINALENEFTKTRPTSKLDKGSDRAILISVSRQPKAIARDSMDELVELATSDDIIVLDTVIQRRSKVDPRFILGKGKLAEIMLSTLCLNANLLIFDQELNASQVHSIIKYTEVRVIDRTQLILDIFARRALSREGKLQVEMAQLKYMLPRLQSRDDALSRLTGGIGARGPGETKLEVDRRRVKDRLSKLEKKLRQVSSERHRRRSRRRKKNIPVISLVGYTNAGKSTLLNALTNSDILAENKLFATLDPTSRRLRFPHDVEVLVTDTVGFIRDLPDELMKAFTATLEELEEADLLVHVIDISNPRFEEQMKVVEKILQDLGLMEMPCLKVFNKIDMADEEFAYNAAKRHNALLSCAQDKSTFPSLLKRIESMIVKNIGLQQNPALS